MPRAPGTQLARAPRLVEEREGQDAGAVGDLRLEDRSAPRSHRALAHLEHLGHDRDVLVEREARECRELAAERVAARIVAEQVAHRAVAERPLEGLRRAPAQRAGEARVEGEPTGARGIRSFGRHASIVGSSPVSAASSACT